MVFCPDDFFGNTPMNANGMLIFQADLRSQRFCEKYCQLAKGHGMGPLPSFWGQSFWQLPQ